MRQHIAMRLLGQQVWQASVWGKQDHFQAFNQTKTERHN